MIQCEIIEQIEDLDIYRSDWERLLSTTPHASFFQSLAWLEVRWRHRSNCDAALRIVLVKDGDAVTGIVPLVIQKRPTPLGDIRKLRFPIDNWGSFYGPVSANPEATMATAASFLEARETTEFDILEFTNLPDYRSTDGTPPSSPKPEFATGSSPWENGECSHVAMLYLEQDWTSYWESRKLQKNRRRNIERCERRLSELGALNFIRYRPEAGTDPRWDLYEACETLAARSWQDGLVDGYTLHHEEVRPFLRDAHIAAVKSGCCDLNLLTLDEKPIAFSYGYSFRGYLDLMRVGFDPAFAKFAPGNALWTRLIRDSYERGDRILDFGPSCLDYKRFWMSTIETSYQSAQYSKTTAAKALRLARKLKAKLPMPSADHTNEEAKQLAARKSRERQNASRASAVDRKSEPIHSH